MSERLVPAFVFALIYRAHRWAERVRRARMLALAHEHAPRWAAVTEQMAREVWGETARVVVEHDVDHDSGDPQVLLHIAHPMEPLEQYIANYDRFVTLYCERDLCRVKGAPMPVLLPQSE